MAKAARTRVAEVREPVRSAPSASPAGWNALQEAWFNNRLLKGRISRLKASLTAAKKREEKLKEELREVKEQRNHAVKQLAQRDNRIKSQILKEQDAREQRLTDLTGY
jgi:chromosome segregation ATPase